MEEVIQQQSETVFQIASFPAISLQSKSNPEVKLVRFEDGQEYQKEYFGKYERSLLEGLKVNPLEQTWRVFLEEDYEICTEDELQMEDADSLDVSDEDDDDEDTFESLDSFLVADDHNSEEDMEFVPQRKVNNKGSLQPKVFDFTQNNHAVSD